MKNNFSYLKDKNFLNQLSTQRVQLHYAKIMLLDFKTERLCNEYVGKVTAGTVTLSATSPVRRTCSLTAVMEELSMDGINIDNELAVNKKIQLMIGYQNDLPNYQKYGDIVWFPLGIFVLSTVNISRAGNNGITLTITGKDKMCLLNGEVAGAIPASTSFHERVELLEDGTTITTNPTIFQIVQESVNHFGGEDLVKIIINDLPKETKRVVKYTGSKPLYYGEVVNNVLNKTEKKFSLNLNDLTKVIKTYYTDDIVGYQYTDFTFPSNLIFDAGTDVASVLKKIQETLGNYEYYYDTDGIFHFQEIKNYLNTSYVPLIKLDNESYTSNFAESTKSVYSFNESELIINYANVPNFENIKNDFYVWGSRKTNQNEVTILFHLVIDDKPIIKEHQIVKYEKNKKVYVRPPQPTDDNSIIETVMPADWRYELYLDCLEKEQLGLGDNYYYSELATYFPLIYDFELNDFKQELMDEPEQLTYWIDFVSPSSVVGKYSVKYIGRRVKAVKDTNVTRAYQKDIEDIILMNRTEYVGDDDLRNFDMKCLELSMQGQNYTEVDDDLYKMFQASSMPVTGYDRARTLLYESTILNEQVTISCIPLYFLSPNDRITIKNKQLGLDGDFIISTIEAPMAVANPMKITAKRATTRL